MPRAYYNEIDAYAAQWLRNLIKAGHIADGDVDERSILDVTPRDLDGYTQCHFFAGVGVWSRALRMAQWSDARAVWTGSCPCQPFSVAGGGAGFSDERHVWPYFQYLIGECRPAVVLGEQVASKDADPWLDLVHTDMEALDYAFGAIAFPSAGVGAPHIRDRTYWVAHADFGFHHGSNKPLRAGRPAADGSSTPSRLGNTEGKRCGEAGDLGAGSSQRASDASSMLGGMAHTSGSRLSEQLGRRIESEGLAAADGAPGPGPTNGFWRDADWLGCTDGKWRPVEPSTFPLANGAASRVGRLRAYGNALNAEAAEAFIAVVMECIA